MGANGAEIVGEHEHWLDDKSDHFKWMVQHYPPGSTISFDDRMAYVIAYNDDLNIIGLTFTNPHEHYEKSMHQIFYLNVESLEQLIELNSH